jgi:hypothetical protein
MYPTSKENIINADLLNSNYYLHTLQELSHNTREHSLQSTPKNGPHLHILANKLQKLAICSRTLVYKYASKLPKLF